MEVHQGAGSEHKKEDWPKNGGGSGVDEAYLVDVEKQKERGVAKDGAGGKHDSPKDDHEFDEEAVDFDKSSVGRHGH